MDNNCLLIMSSIGSLLAGAGSIAAFATFIYQICQNRRRQAEHISCWHVEGRTVAVINNSQLPVYDIVVSIDDYNLQKVGKGPNSCSYILVLPPGEYEVNTPYNGGGMHHHFGASITFRDHRGVYWTKNVVGQLAKDGKRKKSHIIRQLPLPLDEALYIRKH